MPFSDGMLVFIILISLQLSCGNIETVVSLTPFYTLVAEIYHLLIYHGGQVQINNIENFYYHMFSKHIFTTKFNTQTLQELFGLMSFCVILKNSRKGLRVALNEDLLGKFI